MTKPETIDAYLALQPVAMRAALVGVRVIVNDILPDAEEVISYAMPGHRIGKKVIAGYAGFTHHCGFYPHSGGIIPAFAEELDERGFRHSKSGVLFTPTHPLPRDLIERIVAARLIEVGESRSLPSS